MVANQIAPVLNRNLKINFLVVENILKVVVLVRVPSMDQIELFNHLLY